MLLKDVCVYVQIIDRFLLIISAYVLPFAYVIVVTVFCSLYYGFMCINVFINIREYLVACNRKALRWCGKGCCILTVF